MLPTSLLTKLHQFGARVAAVFRPTTDRIGLNAEAIWSLDTRDPKNWSLLAEHHERCRQQYRKKFGSYDLAERLAKHHETMRNHYRTAARLCFADPRNVCPKGGWEHICTRAKGHEGPCAAHPIE